MSTQAAKAWLTFPARVVRHERPINGGLELWAENSASAALLRIHRVSSTFPVVWSLPHRHRHRHRLQFFNNISHSVSLAAVLELRLLFHLNHCAANGHYIGFPIMAIANTIARDAPEKAGLPSIEVDPKLKQTIVGRLMCRRSSME